jgi:hypothetical protein
MGREVSIASHSLPSICSFASSTAKKTAKSIKSMVKKTASIVSCPFKKTRTAQPSDSDSLSSPSVDHDHDNEGTKPLMIYYIFYSYIFIAETDNASNCQSSVIDVDEAGQVAEETDKQELGTFLQL